MLVSVIQRHILTRALRIAALIKNPRPKTARGKPQGQRQLSRIKAASTRPSLEVEHDQGIPEIAADPALGQCGRDQVMSHFGYHCQTQEYWQQLAWHARDHSQWALITRAQDSSGQYP